MADTRARIGKQIEKSATPGSVIRTDASNEQEYVAPGTAGQVLQIVGGIPTWAAPAPAPIAMDDLTDADTTTVAPATGDLLKWDGTNWVPTCSPTSMFMPIAPFGSTASTAFAVTAPGTYSSGIGTLSITNPSPCRAMNVLIQHNNNLSVHGNAGSALIYTDQGFVDNGSGTLTLDASSARAQGIFGSFQVDFAEDDNKIQYITLAPGASATLRHEVRAVVSTAVGTTNVTCTSHLSIFGVTV